MIITVNETLWNPCFFLLFFSFFWHSTSMTLFSLNHLLPFVSNLHSVHLSHKRHAHADADAHTHTHTHARTVFDDLLIGSTHTCTHTHRYTFHTAVCVVLRVTHFSTA